MNAELLKKLLAAGMDADEAIALAKGTETAPADGVKAVIEQMSKSLNAGASKEDLARVEEKLDRCVTALTTIIPNGLEAFGGKVDEMQKSLTPIQEQMSKALGQPKAVQTKEGGENLPEVGANGDAEPEVNAAKQAEKLEEMRKSLTSNKDKAKKALAAAKNKYAIDSDSAAEAFTSISAANSEDALATICAKYKLDLA